VTQSFLHPFSHAGNSHAVLSLCHCMLSSPAQVPKQLHAIAAAALACVQISARHQPRTNDGAQWAPDYHTKLYNLTDDAVRGQCTCTAHNMACIWDILHMTWLRSAWPAQLLQHRHQARSFAACLHSMASAPRRYHPSLCHLCQHSCSCATSPPSPTKLSTAA
jgi:hypothetical protein